jgi:vitamin B12 transporter
VIGYQDKFYGWPGAYTGFATLPETDHTKTSLVLLNHRNDTSDGCREFAAYYRNLDEEYDFDRTTEECCESGSFEH